MRMPKITVVTACLNQAATIEQTIQSVITQQYEDVEYILIDGKSTDGTLDIIHRHDGRIATVVSESDSGQYHAIAKGMKLGSGEVMAWLNGDDVYFPWTLRVVGEVFATYPEVDWIVGLPSFIDENGVLCEISNRHPAYVQADIAKGYHCDQLFGAIQQESMFWRRRLWDAVGGLDLSLKYAGDYELWTRFAGVTNLIGIAVPLAAFRIDPTRQRSRVFQDKYNAEVRSVFEKRARLGGKLVARIGNKSFMARLLIRFLAIAPCRLVAKSIVDPTTYCFVSTWSNRNRKSFFGMMAELSVRRAGRK